MVLFIWLVQFLLIRKILPNGWVPSGRVCCQGDYPFGFLLLNTYFPVLQRGEESKRFIIKGKTNSQSYFTDPRVSSLFLGNRCWIFLYWGVSDHHKAIPDQIIKKKWFALMDHNIFMKQIGSLVFKINHWSLNEGFFFLWLYEFFSCLKTVLLDFLVTHILKCLAVQNNIYGQN